MDDTYAYIKVKIYFKEGARDGGLIGKKSGPPPESGPNSQGLPGLLKRVRNL